MADGLPPRPAVTGPTRLAIAYLDETKKLRDEGHSVVFAGCAAHDEHYAEFNRRWGLTLAGTGITTVKMSAALAYRDEFYGWQSREDERDSLLFRLATRIHESPLIKISAPIMAGDFERLSEQQRKKLKDPQYCGFEICVRGLLNHFPETDALQIACDLTENYAEDCVRLFNLLRSREPAVRRRLLGISFADDTYIAALQAADMIAYCARSKAELDRFGQQPQAIVQRIIDLFSSRDGRQTYFVYRAAGDGIGHAERE